MTTFHHLPETVAVLYSELLDQLLASQGAAHQEPGSFVSKAIGGKRYWYRQTLAGGEKRQHYVGAESDELLAQVHHQREALADLRRRKKLVDMLLAGGATGQPAPFARVLRVLAEANVFNDGGMLVGTHALACYANMFAVRFEAQSLTTADIDVAQPIAAPSSRGSRKAIRLLERLRESEPLFVAVPELDARYPSTSFRVRGRDLRVDFIAPSLRGRTSPVVLSNLGAAAQPLPGLDYLLELEVPAALLVDSGLLVKVPDPARFALHKLWVSRSRPVSEQLKARKDARQAELLIALLREERPGDLDGAIEALRRRKTMWQKIRVEVERLMG